MFIRLKVTFFCFSKDISVLPTLVWNFYKKKKKHDIKLYGQNNYGLYTNTLKKNSYKVIEAIP